MFSILNFKLKYDASLWDLFKKKNKNASGLLVIT